MYFSYKGIITTIIIIRIIEISKSERAPCLEQLSFVISGIFLFVSVSCPGKPLGIKKEKAAHITTRILA